MMERQPFPPPQRSQVDDITVEIIDELLLKFLQVTQGVAAAEGVIVGEVDAAQIATDQPVKKRMFLFGQAVTSLP